MSGSHEDEDGLGSWDPLPLPELTEIFKSAPFRWWVAGGTAIDLFLERVTRFHDDLDVEVLRADQIKVQRLLAPWDMHIAQDGRLRPWRRGEYLAEGDGSIWCRRNPDSAWTLQILLGESAGEDWLFRRDPRVRIPIKLLGRAQPRRNSLFDAAVQLLFKSKNTRPKDRADFEAVLPNLDQADRSRLISALTVTDPRHPWLAGLESAGS